MQARRRVAVPPTLTAVNQIQYGRGAGSERAAIFVKSDAEGSSGRHEEVIRNNLLLDNK